MIGIELASAERAAHVMQALLERGWIVLTGGKAGNVITLTPPLTIEWRILKAFVSALEESLH
jgi:4-aminobutyrate aminotransferase-like enzyme